MLALAACQRPTETQHFVGGTEGTTYHVTVSSLPAHVTRARVQSAIDKALAEVDTHLSTWRADYEISRFNASASTDWMPRSCWPWAMAT